MYWVISIVWTLLGTIIFWIILSAKYNKLDIFEQRALSTLSVFHSIPNAPGYLDLKFTVLRHAFVFLLSSALIFWIKSDFVLTLVLIVNFLYCWLPISRYRHRKKDVEETALRPDGQATAHFLSIPVKDSFFTVIHAVICLAITYILYAIRP